MLESFYGSVKLLPLNCINIHSITVLQSVLLSSAYHHWAGVPREAGAFPRGHWVKDGVKSGGVTCTWQDKDTEINNYIYIHIWQSCLSSIRRDRCPWKNPKTNTHRKNIMQTSRRRGPGLFKLINLWHKSKNLRNCCFHFDFMNVRLI